MLITATILLAGLSAEVKRNSYIESFYGASMLDGNTEQVDYIVAKKNSNRDYTQNKEDIFLRQIQRNLILEGVNPEVLSNTMNVLRNVSAFFLSNLNEENVYKSSYGTAIMELELADDLFTLEVGKDSFGYFSEVNGRINHKVEEVFFSNGSGYDEALGSLNQDILEFITVDAYS